MNTFEIKGPFSYSGNKYRIFKNYLSNTLRNFNNIYEPFLGSGVCLYNSKNGGIGIDIDKNVIELHKSLFDNDLIYKIKESYNKYFPNGRNKESYIKMRNDFNELFKNNGTNSENVHLLHLLVQLSFNSLLRFSKNGYNVPFGMKEIDIIRIENHQKILKSKKIEFILGKYENLDLSIIDKNKDLIYLDPPYIASKFQYGGWNKQDELLLLEYIDMLNSKGYKFILSNTFNHRGVRNQDLIDWASNYVVKNINMSYNSWTASVRSVKSEKNTNEVLISNFNY